MFIPAKALVDVYTGSDYVAVSDTNVISLKITDLEAKLVTDEFAKKSDITDITSTLATTESVNAVKATADAAASKADINEGKIGTLENTVGNAESGLVKDVADIKTDLTSYEVKSVDSTASNGVALELSEAGVLKVTADVSVLATKESVDTISTNVANLTANLKVKDVNTTASNGVSLSLTDGKVGVSVDVATLTPKVKENLDLKANEVKISAAIGGTTDAPNYAADSTVQAVLSGMDSRIKANADSIKAAVAGGVTAIKPGDGIKVDTTGEGGTTQPIVSVKVNPDSNIRATESGLDLVWLE